MWAKERIGTRVNITHTEEALRVGPDIVGRACPCCPSMFEGGIRAKDATERLQALDLAEPAAQALGRGPPVRGEPACECRPVITRSRPRRESITLKQGLGNHAIDIGTAGHLDSLS